MGHYPVGGSPLPSGITTLLRQEGQARESRQSSIFCSRSATVGFVTLSSYSSCSHDGRDSEFIQDELAEIIANHEYELSVIPQTSYLSGWTNCFSGSLTNGSSNIRRTMLGIVMQMMQQLTGINFIFYFGNVFFTSLGTIHNPFLISLATSLVNMGSTPVSFYIIERYGRRTILIYGAALMVVAQFIVGIVGVTAGKTSEHNNAAVSAMIAFICLFISTFAMTWGPAAWVVVGEIFPLPIRSRGVGLSTSSNWFWNCVSKVPENSSAVCANAYIRLSELSHHT